MMVALAQEALLGASYHVGKILKAHHRHVRSKLVATLLAGRRMSGRTQTETRCPAIGFWGTRIRAQIYPGGPLFNQ